MRKTFLKPPPSIGSPPPVLAAAFPAAAPPSRERPRPTLRQRPRPRLPSPLPVDAAAVQRRLRGAKPGPRLEGAARAEERLEGILQADGHLPDLLRRPDPNRIDRFGRVNPCIKLAIFEVHICTMYFSPNLSSTNHAAAEYGLSIVRRRQMLLSVRLTG